ncbi:hypothetical protein EB06_01196 [Enterococcus cecorum]|uniref:hypothetical protein n=1 Tax=Enterococcus cecorum TaxID=44008 RepID=UPI000DE94922|nr:hypothetical protein [Enterococcus cecorum]RBR32312.1 hypothetical protein EB06_01196 [Enterococcus cecorum]
MTKQELFKALEILKEECQKYDYTLLIDLSSDKENFEYTTHVGDDIELAASLSWIMGTLPNDVVKRAIYVWQKTQDILNQSND